MLIGNHMRVGIGNDSHAVLLIQSDTTNGSIVFADTSRGGSTHAIVRGGAIAHSTTRQKFGASSIRFQAGRFLIAADHADWEMGDGDWMIECWARFDGGGWYTLFGQRDDPLTDFSWYFQNHNRVLRGYTSPDGTTPHQATSVPNAIPVATWTHLVAQRRNDVLEAFIDGVRCPTDRVVAYVTHNSALGVFFGRTSSGTHELAGYLEEIKITKGLARYPSSGFSSSNRMN